MKYEQKGKTNSGYYLIFEERKGNFLTRIFENLVRALGKNKEYCYNGNANYKTYSNRKRKFLKANYPSVQAALEYFDRR